MNVSEAEYSDHRKYLSRLFRDTGQRPDDRRDSSHNIFSHNYTFPDPLTVIKTLTTCLTIHISDPPARRQRLVKTILSRAFYSFKVTLVQMMAGQLNCKSSLLFKMKYQLTQRREVLDSGRGNSD